MDHAQIGLLLRFNSKLETSIPAPFIWKSPRLQRHICGFSFTPMSKCSKRPWNLYKYKDSFLKNILSLTIEYRLYLKFLLKPRCLGWFKTSQALRSAVEKTRLNSSKHNFIAKSSPFSKKRKLSIVLNFLFPFVSFIGVFSHYERAPAILLMDDIY